MSFLLFPVYNKILYLCIINHVLSKALVLSVILQLKTRSLSAGICLMFLRQKVVTRSVNIAYRYIVAN